MSAPLLDQLSRYGDHLDRAIDAHLEGASHRHADPRPSPPTRRLALFTAAVASVAVAGLGVAVLSASDGPAEAWAGWSPTVQVTDLDDLAALDAACGSADAPPLVAVDVRGDGAAALYANDERWTLCQAARTAAGSFEATTRVSERGEDLAAARAVAGPDRPIATVAMGWHGDPAASFAWGVRDRSVTGIELSTNLHIIEVSLHGDLWLAWWPDDTTHEAQAVGRTASGAVIVDQPAGTLAAPLPDRGDLIAEIATDGTPLERDIIADGIVTWPELRAGLEAWVGCVADAGYELTIEVDDDARTYQASSQTVSVPAGAGQPDDLAGHALLEPIGAAIDTCRVQQLSRIERLYVQQ